MIRQPPRSTLLPSTTLFRSAAAKAGVDLYYEAAVAGAIPLLRPLRESLAGDQLRRVVGIVNGTTNYILSRMAETGAGFAEALAERSEEHTSELQSRQYLVCRLLLAKKK